MSADLEALARPQSGAMDLLLEVARKARLIVGGGLCAGALAVGLSYLVTPTFTSSTVLLPPAQASGGAQSALASLGALANLAGGGVARAPLDQYVALALSTRVADRMIERFKLHEVYDEALRLDVRKQFWKNLRVSAGRRDGLITIEVDDHDPKRAAEMAAGMVEEFRRVAAEIAVTEAQQRRVFFEERVRDTGAKLEAAQKALQDSGLSANTLKAEPRVAVEAYAKLRAELTSAQVRLQGLLSTFAAQAPEVVQQRALVGELAGQLRQLESQAPRTEDGAYLSRFREFKYQEALFEQFSRQLELARIDEGREGGLVQVVDVAQVPEKKSKPGRAKIGMGVSIATGLLLLLWVMLRFQLRSRDEDGSIRAKLKAIWPAVWGRA